MKIIYTHKDIPNEFSKSIFLAGPSLRPGQEKELESWRKDAIKILDDKGFDGILFVPENRDGKFDENFNYEDQIKWEHKCLNVADCIVFWVPRDISIDSSGLLKMPAFTTNVEFGAWCSSGKVVFGSPPDLDKRKNKYLEYYAKYYKMPNETSLIETLDSALDMLGDGSLRTDGECYVPLFIWKTASFQSWYKSQVGAGNRLDSAEVLYSFRPGYKDFVFLWVLKVDIWIEEEQRHKNNEFVLARTDISSVLLWKRNQCKEDIELVLIKEFRSPARTSDSFIKELPSGSSFSAEEDPLEIASHEVFEETGFHIDPSRLKEVSSRQLAGTFSSHKSNFYTAEINEEEINWFKAQKDLIHGNIEDSEVTFIEVFTVNEVLNNQNIDWTTIGQIFSVIYNNKFIA